MIEGPCSADDADKTAPNYLDREPSLPKHLYCLKYQNLETFDNWKQLQIAENDLNCKELVPDTFQGSPYLTLKLCSMWCVIKNIEQMRETTSVVIQALLESLDVCWAMVEWPR